MKEKILQTLRELGFICEFVDDLGYDFSYESTHYLYLPNDKDEKFLNICIPVIADMDSNNLLASYQMVDKLNHELKYTKAYVVSGKVWLFYERELLENDDLADVLAGMILCLDGCLHFAHHLYRQAGMPIDQDEEDGTDSDETETVEDDDTDSDGDDNPSSTEEDITDSKE